MNIAIIPARSGSKRISNKNIKPFLGKPIIAYSIEAAKKTEIFDRIIVSTDSEKIAQIAEEYGAEVPFIRPLELADDRASISSVLVHALNWLIEHGSLATFACRIFATAPFIHPEYIREGFMILRENAASSVYSVTTFSSPIFKAFKIEEDGYLKMLWPKYNTIPSNDIPEFYQDAGQFYWIDCEKYLKEQNVPVRDMLPVILPRYMAQDINTPEDWDTAEYMYKVLFLSRGHNGSNTHETINE
ncbi:MAG: pseudaminic acid cytidylyltransferase [Maribacter sp.]|nr:pseudaminic acid cytidylyltransferase [Candidatus Brocadiaceae bacterium]MCP4978495.1 pseudaminic acid cytidylyltransferase [Maribacter sp.]